MDDGEVRKSSVTVRIAGDEHVLRSTAEPEYTKKCARFLDERVREIRTLSGLADTHRAVILAALSITDRYFQSREELDQVRREIVDRSDALASEIEAALGESVGNA
jgi:cell division protein ZapA (FtsZ GTPase activity inhibitor)